MPANYIIVRKIINTVRMESPITDNLKRYKQQTWKLNWNIPPQTICRNWCYKDSAKSWKKLYSKLKEQPGLQKKLGFEEVQNLFPSLNNKMPTNSSDYLIHILTIWFILCYRNPRLIQILHYNSDFALLFKKIVLPMWWVIHDKYVILTVVGRYFFQ